MVTVTDDSFDLIVLGAGPAGEKAAAQAAYWGKRVAVVERRSHPGGTMVDGAVSSKTMREAALYLTGFRRRDLYAVGLDLAPAVAVERLRRRTDDVVRLMTESAAANLVRHGITVVQGDAVLGPERTVTVTTAGGGDVRRLVGDV